MATMIKMADWFNFLRVNNVFDNTKIILVADYGRSLAIGRWKENV